MQQTVGVTDTFAAAVNRLDEEAFQLLYGRWDPLEPTHVAALFAEASLRWYVAGGRAARMGAPARHHEDTDVVVRAEDLDQLRQALADWHLWEASTGSLRPLLPGFAITEGCQQLWARRNAREPWQRADGTLAHHADAIGLETQGGAAIFRAAAAVQVVQLAGDDAGELLRTMRMRGAVHVLNVPIGDPAADALRELGASVAVRQHEMLLEL